MCEQWGGGGGGGGGIYCIRTCLWMQVTNAKKRLNGQEQWCMGNIGDAGHLNDTPQKLKGCFNPSFNDQISPVTPRPPRNVCTIEV